MNSSTQTTQEEIQLAQATNEYILHTKFCVLHALLGADCGGRRGRDAVAWMQEEMLLQNLLEEVIQDMAIMDITPYPEDEDHYELHYARYPQDMIPYPEVWNGNYPPRYDEDEDVCCVGCGERVCGFTEEPPHKDRKDEAVCDDCWVTDSKDEYEDK